MGDNCDPVTEFGHGLLELRGWRQVVAGMEARGLGAFEGGRHRKSAPGTPAYVELRHRDLPRRRTGSMMAPLGISMAMAFTVKSRRDRSCLYRGGEPNRTDYAIPVRIRRIGEW